MENKRDDRSRCQRSESEYDKETDENEKSNEDEGDFSSPIFDWLLMICGDVSSFVTESCMEARTQNETDQRKGKEGKVSGGRAEVHHVGRTDGGQYDLDHFKW